MFGHASKRAREHPGGSATAIVAPVNATHDRRLEGRRALVTGASRGLGRQIVRAFVAEGAAVTGLARSSDALSALARETGCDVAVADVRDAAVAAAAIDAAALALGGLDAIVNAAAIDCPALPVGDLPVAAWRDTLDTSLTGVFVCCRAALPHLLQAGGTIVNITSVAGIRVWPNDAAYTVAKAGVEMLTRQIAVEYGARGVRAVCVAPGVIDGGMTDAVTDASERAAMARLSPAGRMGTPAEVAEAVVWLTSEAASYVNGSTLRVDGGFVEAWHGR